MKRHCFFTKRCRYQRPVRSIASGINFFNANFWCSACPAPPIPAHGYSTGILGTFLYRLNRHPGPGPSYWTTDHCTYTNIFFHPSSDVFIFIHHLSSRFRPMCFSLARPRLRVFAIWLPSFRINQIGVELFRMILLGHQSMAAAAILTLRSFLRKHSWRLCHRQFSSYLFLHDLYSCGEAQKWFAAAFCNC